MDLPILRPDGRAIDQLRHITLEPNFAPNATGSVLCCFGDTKVICAATLERKVPRWMQYQGVSGGWITAEYSMLPYSTLERKGRDVNRGKIEGRTMEIQRLIGRSLRAVTDLQKLPGYTLWIDCDVLQADGGTRTASITGAYVAAQIAVQTLMKEGKLKENPFTEAVAAVSVGVYEDTEILDLAYLEDKDASVDANIVMTASGKMVELQFSGEEATFSKEQMASMLALGEKGIKELSMYQKTTIADALK